MMLLWVLLFASLGSVGAVAGAALLLAFPGSIRKTLLPGVLCFATGTLLGAAFLGMIPSGAASIPVRDMLEVVLAGIVGFFLLEKLLIWRHSHHDGARDGQTSAGALILIGDAFHNLVDGVVIAAAFLTSIPLGIAASLAVIAHEIPQEVGDFGILLESGYSPVRALVLNLLSSLATLPGAVLGFYWLAGAYDAIPYVLAISASSFIYIAIADLVPMLHRQVGLASAVLQIALIIAGIATIAALHH